MLDESTKQQVKQYFERIKNPVSITLYSGDHEKREELVSFLNDIESLSPMISIQHSSDVTDGLRFTIISNGNPTGIHFSGIPMGHEFTSFILAILQSGGNPIKLEEGILSAVSKLKGEFRFETFISLDCHNCPEVVQTLNSFALVNPNISHNMIDGAMYPELVKEKNIQGVPAVYLNGERFLSGKAEASIIFDKLLELYTIPSESESSDGLANPSEIYDVTVIGGGPSGVTAAVYAARKGLRTLVIADRLGGQVKDTLGIENIISIPYTTGPELIHVLADQLEKNQIKKKENVRVQKIEQGQTKIIHLNTGEKILSKTVILSTGAKWRELNVPGEKEFVGKGVAYCPHCDGPFFKDKDVAVIGGGNSGVEAALDLSGIVKSVTLVEFGDKLNADKVLLDKVASSPNIKTLVKAQTTEIQTGVDKVTGLTYKDRNTEQVSTIPLDGVFVQIGLVPNSSFVKDLVATNRFGEILVDEKCKTNVDGIFACGDVTNTPYKQIIIAMGEGAKAAISAFEYLLHAA
ncbi:Alkyl hydroperoxide reductase, large subunit [Leptospira biflexa serovar Patoc strain 'Patoc 1 (Ames)']|uniref:Alkyl hydroperoxide reductase subunit F n=1 Tax=Leptospira biflexa serovar Patoc (strain Patoc 1 / ATCC 23582 / Paris) TaxID=456481 RepID=B0SPG9_LEPBP|nr:alkyl hydroperoxide reductase subunit F [Leptospira biflexa]ABZ95379.1 Alkyl hydroperoxide reductase, large subunit [Leptospira biflexa serovar Patoc strain 'Patoc 1 (Ames)']ABZ99075.1 Alkyl hydroperoxide reductase subunit F [Leptospira biflexa serovar Patoc strain 'Patoc 1 (Paris)']